MTTTATTLTIDQKLTLETEVAKLAQEIINIGNIMMNTRTLITNDNETIAYLHNVANRLHKLERQGIDNIYEKLGV